MTKARRRKKRTKTKKVMANGAVAGGEKGG
jgi:hypothetical protein